MTGTAFEVRARQPGAAHGREETRMQAGPRDVGQTRDADGAASL
jgi:hypothetical protein